MHKAQSRFITTFFLFLILTSCNVAPLSNSVDSVPCKERDLEAASKLFRTEFENGRLVRLLPQDKMDGWKLELNPDGSRIAISFSNQNDADLDGIYIFDAIEGHLLCILPAKHNEASLNGLAFSSNGSILAITYYDGTVVLRDVNVGEILHELKTIDYESPYGWISFDKNDSTVVSSGYWQPVRVWNVDTGQLIQDINPENAQDKVTHAAISSGGDLLTFVEMGKEHSLIQIDNISTMQSKVKLNGSTSERYLLFGEGNTIYSLNNNSEVSIWDTTTGERIRSLKPDTGCSVPCAWEVETRITLGANGKLLLMQDPNRIVVWNTETWQEVINERTNSVEPIEDAVISSKRTLVAISYGTEFHFLFLDQ